MSDISLRPFPPFDVALLAKFTVHDVEGVVRPFRYVSTFSSRLSFADWYRKGVAAHFEEAADIEQFVSGLGINYAMFRPYNNVVITEQPLLLDPVLFKLSTGLQITSQEEFDFNGWLDQTSTAKWHSRFYRPPHD